MAYIKPGAVKGAYTWTGKRWVRTPERTDAKARLKKEVDQATVGKTKSSQGKLMETENPMAKYPGGKYKPMVAGRGAALRPKGIGAEGPKVSASKVSKKPVDTAPVADKTKPVKPTPSSAPASGSGSSSSSTTKKTAKTPAKKAATVSQSNTEWVKKGDVVNGKTVTKGYVAQKGKPERKVTANVKLVVDTTRGKAGSKVSYTKGRATKKGK